MYVQMYVYVYALVLVCKLLALNEYVCSGDNEISFHFIEKMSPTDACVCNPIPKSLACDNCRRKCISQFLPHMLQQQCCRFLRALPFHWVDTMPHKSFGQISNCVHFCLRETAARRFRETSVQQYCSHKAKFNSKCQSLEF